MGAAHWAAFAVVYFSFDDVLFLGELAEFFNETLVFFIEHLIDSVHSTKLAGRHKARFGLHFLVSEVRLGLDGHFEGQLVVSDHFFQFLDSEFQILIFLDQKFEPQSVCRTHALNIKNFTIYI